VQQTYQKHLVSLRAWLQGSGKHEALRALEYARPLHDGLRKDGVTPEFAHQVFMMNFARNFDPMFQHPDATLAVLALHDVVEDKNVSILDIQAEFGDEIAQPVFLMTAPEGESAAEKEQRFREMAECRGAHERRASHLHTRRRARDPQPAAERDRSKGVPGEAGEEGHRHVHAGDR
jgi:(p)ppGpp synthase/HD superfamily hydrolase